MYLTQHLKQDKEGFEKAFPAWWHTQLSFNELLSRKWSHIGWEHKNVVQFMLGMGAPIMEQVCGVYADANTIQSSFHLSDISFFNDLEKEANSVRTAPPQHISAFTAYSNLAGATGISNIPPNQALSSSYIVMVNGAQDVDLTTPATKTTKHIPCQHNTRAVSIRACKEGIMQHVMDSNVPITHLCIDYVKGKSQLSHSELKCNVLNYIDL